MNKTMRPYQMAGLFAAAAAVLIAVVWAVIPAAAATGNIRVNPATNTVATLNTNFVVTLTQNADVPTSGAQVDFAFNQSMFQIVSISAGTSYNVGGGPTLVNGNASAITSANSTGLLNDVAVFLIAPDNVATGDRQFLTITMQAIVCGKSPITLSQVEMLDGRPDPDYGDNIPVTGSNGSVIGVTDLDFNPAPPATPDGVPDWTAGTSDGDCDGYRGGHETALGTNPAALCAASSTANNEAGGDFWPLDFNDDQKATTLDLVGYVTKLNTTPAPGSPYDVRWDLRDPVNNQISTLDLVGYAALLNKACTR